MRIMTIFACLVAVVLWAGCDSDGDPVGPCGTDLPARNGDRVSISQGIWGDVWFWSGDFMPVCTSGTVTAVGREIRIHELTSRDDVDEESPAFYSAVRTPLVDTAWSDTDGFFQVSLAPGQYSLFVVEDTLLYANRFDGDGNIFPVEVLADSVTAVRFDIEYEATW